jgi:peptidoglycan/xylan/chitin deacetylase (PgdA/CDA1 family)
VHLAQRISPVRWSLDDDARCIALTFDDGPDPVFTPRVLDLLAAAGVRATFFLVGQKAAAHPALVARIAAEGHAIGSHSSTHPDPDTVGLGRLTQEYRDGRAAVEAVLGRAVHLFRPPMGRHSFKGALAARRADVDAWIWTIDPEDWRPAADPDELVGFVLSRAGPREVVLMHDGIASPVDERCHDRSTTVAALERLLEEFRNRRLACGRLPERSPAGQVDTP